MISAHTDALRTPTHATDHARGGEAPARSEHAALTLQIILQNAATYIPYVCSPLLPRSLFLTMPRCGAVQHPIIFNVRARICPRVGAASRVHHAMRSRSVHSTHVMAAALSEASDRAAGTEARGSAASRSGARVGRRRPGRQRMHSSGPPSSCTGLPWATRRPCSELRLFCRMLHVRLRALDVRRSVRDRA